VRINAALDPMGLSYSKFMGALIKKGIMVDRKILAGLAESHPEVFKRVVAQVK
jgi:large subunit ribosomal protein L20